MCPCGGKYFLAYFLKRAEITSRYGKIFGISRIISIANKSSVRTVGMRAPVSPGSPVLGSTSCHQISVPCVAPYHAQVPLCDQRRSQVQIRTANHSAPMTQIDQWDSTRIWSVWFVCSAAVSIGHYHCPGLTLLWHYSDITLRGHTADALTCHDGLWIWNAGEGTLGHVNYELFSQSDCLIQDKLMKVQ